MALSFGLRDDVIALGRDEDGAVVEGLAFYVVAELADGRRFAHAHSFVNRVRHYDAEEGVTFWGYCDAAEGKGQALLARIEAHVAAGGRLDAACWNEIDPAYGSAAYQDLDAVGYFKARERQAARDAGEALFV